MGLLGYGICEDWTDRTDGIVFYGFFFFWLGNGTRCVCLGNWAWDGCSISLSIRRGFYLDLAISDLEIWMEWNGGDVMSSMHIILFR